MVATCSPARPRNTALDSRGFLSLKKPRPLFARLRRDAVPLTCPYREEVPGTKPKAPARQSRPSRATQAVNAGKSHITCIISNHRRLPASHHWAICTRSVQHGFGCCAVPSRPIIHDFLHVIRPAGISMRSLIPLDSRARTHVAMLTLLPAGGRCCRIRRRSLLSLTIRGNGLRS